MSDPPPLIPNALRCAYRGWQWMHVWTNDEGGVTYKLRQNQRSRFVKLRRREANASLVAEAERMRWVAPYQSVPKVVECEHDEAWAWLVTEALVGVDASQHSLRARPEAVVRALAEGLKRFHTTPVTLCPYSFRLDDALELAHCRVARNEVNVEKHFHRDHAHLGIHQALDLLVRTRPADEDLVVCHGDYCPPNVLIDRDVVNGYVDLGGLGAADRWWDLAIATWSVGWNIGSEYEREFLIEYGAELDPYRLSYYRLLHDLVT